MISRWQKGRGDILGPLAGGVLDVGGGVLGQVSAAFLARGVGSAAVEDQAGKDGDAAGRGDHGVAGVGAGVADAVVGCGVAVVLDEFATAEAVSGQQVDGAVFFAHVVECAPAGDAFGMIAHAGVDVGAVLMPGKAHAGAFAFDDVLIAVQKSGFAERGAADLGHQRAKQKLAQPRLFAIALADKVAASAVVDAQGVGTFAIHLSVHPGDGGRAFLA